MKGDWRVEKEEKTRREERREKLSGKREKKWINLRKKMRKMVESGKESD